MTYSLIAHTTGASASGGNTFTTSPSINTTGADLIVVGVGQYQAATVPGVLSDSVGNTYTPLTVQSNVSDSVCRLFYIQGSGITSATHTFTLTGSAFFGILYALAFSGSVAAPSDGENGFSGGSPVTSSQTGAVVPSVDNDLIVTMATTSGNTLLIDSGFIKADASTDFTGGVCMGGGAAYFIQTTAGSVDPTWSWNSVALPALTIAAFKASATAITAWPRATVSFFR